MSGKAESSDELRSLLTRLEEGALDAEGYQRIEQLVQGDLVARQLFIDFMLLDGELHWTSGRSAAPASHAAVDIHDMEVTTASAQRSSDESVDDISTTRRMKITSTAASRHWSIARLSRPLPLIGAAVAAGLLIATTTVLFTSTDRLSVPRAGSIAVAELQSDEGCIWAGQNAPVAVGATLYAGSRLELTSGVARLLFARGGKVLVEGPAVFEPVSPTSLRLERGTVAVRASGPVKDFVVVSPDASIVDLGTSFAVHCDSSGATEVEVFEGGVEVFPGSDRTQGQVVEMGTAVSVGPDGKSVALVASPPEHDRFATVLEQLWEDMRVVSPPGEVHQENHRIVTAEFSDERVTDAVDTFYNAKPGQGWLTPWVAAGNPTGEILRGDQDFGINNPYLQIRFTNSHERAIAREYGPRGDFDPSQPHVISWRWRLEGSPDEFGGDFHDRVAFYGNPFFRRNSWPTSSWLIGVAGGDEVATGRRGGRGSSNEFLKRERGLATGNDVSVTPRHVYPKRWYFFDSNDDSASGSVFDRRNMIDTGMALKFGVMYHFAVAVYPQEGRYDAAIRDDKRTVVRTGLRFRDPSAKSANVFHATVSANRPTDRHGFSIDSLRVQPLEGTGLQRQLEDQTLGDARSDGGKTHSPK